MKEDQVGGVHCVFQLVQSARLLCIALLKEVSITLQLARADHGQVDRFLQTDRQTNIAFGCCYCQNVSLTFAWTYCTVCKYTV